MQLVENFKDKIIFKFGYWAIRIGLALTFIVSGIRKLPGIKFTTLPIDNPVGAYFNAMYETGFYWNFIGYLQIVIGVMAIFNRSIIIANVLMMPIVINIFLISISLQMRGTPIITSAMVLGNLYLTIWHYKNYTSLFKKPIS